MKHIQSIYRKAKRAYLFPIFLGLIFFTWSLSLPAQSTEREVKKLEEYKRIDKPGRDEVSGIVASRSQPGVFWVHGDSGTDPRIYAINREGEMHAGDTYQGLRIGDFTNIDWEDISLDGSGNIILADIGNNCKCRENLAFIVFEEPASFTSLVNNLKKIKIRYPGERRMWGLLDSESYDAEAVFYWQDTIYVITKEDRGTPAQLFALRDYSDTEVNTLTKVTDFDFGGEVTAADLYPDKPMLAILTYSEIWLFSGFQGADFFSGQIQKFPYKGAGQTEAIAFEDAETLIMTNERGELFEIKISDFE